MARLDLVEETFVVAPLAALSPLRDEATWSRWFPGIVLTCVDDRGDLGKRWTVSGELVGSAEVWLEKYADGVIVHVYFPVDWALRPTERRSRAQARFRSRYALPLKKHMVALKDAAEAGRRPGEPRCDRAEPIVSAARPATRVRRIGGA